jgi:hypothetical protein
MNLHVFTVRDQKQLDISLGDYQGKVPLERQWQGRQPNPTITGLELAPHIEALL